MKNRKKWLEERKTGIGGSDVAAILGIPGAFKTKVQIWKSKVDSVSGPEDDNALMWWGTEIEPLIIKRYKRDTGNRILPKKETNKIFRHPDKPWLIANLDAIAIENKKRIILEAKYSEANYQKDWGKSGTEDIPMKYYFQVQHYMNVMGFDTAHVAAKIGGDPNLRIYKIKRSDKLIDIIDEPLRIFWFEHVLQNKVPEPSCIFDVRLVNPEIIIGKAEATEREIEAIRRAKEIQKQIKDLEEEAEKQKTIAASGMGDKNLLVINGGIPLMSSSVNKNGTRSYRLV